MQDDKETRQRPEAANARVPFDRRGAHPSAASDNESIPSGEQVHVRHRGLLGSVGLGLITGAADDDPSAIRPNDEQEVDYGTTREWPRA